MEHIDPPTRQLSFSAWLKHHLLPLYIARQGLRTTNAISQRREELVQRWNQFTAAEREDQLQSLKADSSMQGPVGGDDADEPSDYCPKANVDYDVDACCAGFEKPQDDPFCPGDATTPVRADALRQFCIYILKLVLVFQVLRPRQAAHDKCMRQP